MKGRTAVRPNEIRMAIMKMLMNNNDCICKGGSRTAPTDPTTGKLSRSNFFVINILIKGMIEIEH